MKIIITESQMNGLVNHTRKTEIKEDLFLKKNSEKGLLYIFSDKEDKRGKFIETSGLAKEFRKIGFDWNGEVGNWVGPISKLEVVNELIKNHNKVRKIVQGLEQIEDFIQDSDASPDKKSLLMKNLDLYIDDLTKATTQAAMDSVIRKYLDFYSKFHRYSLVNTWLILIQKSDASKVASFNAWKKNNRGVKKGATTIYIWYPMNVKAPDNADINNVDFGEVDDAMKSGRSVTRFALGKVYDVSDTYPLSDKGNVPDEPEWHAKNEPSEIAEEIIKRVKELAESLTIDITKGDSKSGEKGYSAGDHINLSSDVSGVGEASTLIHELAHELLHWRGKSIFHIDDPNQTTREMKEIQAESVSYIVLKHYNLPVTHHPTYLVLWGANKEKIMSSLDIIRKCARFIIDGIDEI
jgi:hypothetical protein